MFESNAKSKNILQKKFNLTWASELILVGWLASEPVIGNNEEIVVKAFIGTG